MCGICGILRTNKSVSREEIEGMTSTLAHRGPDGSGVWLDDSVGIGHRRLSIIDLETGKQPMCNEDETVWITFNGEIYNFLELRDQLLAKGHRFRTHSDTEVIIHAYEEWGDDCVGHFRGMFAFCIVDRKNRRLFLARDHLGIKPLLYYRDNGCFAFASELQALRTIPGADFELDLQAIDQYLWLQYIPAPRSIYRSVSKLPPAHRMRVGFDGRTMGPEEYWRVEFKPDHNRSETQWLEELDAVLRDSVKTHLVADVPFGAFLSGGVDSSAVVAYMAQILDRPVKTFTIGFEEKEFNELEYAAAAAKKWGADHHVETVKPDALAVLPDLVLHYGEPFGDSSALPTYYVCRMARKHVPMVLSGDGGDEAFAGYQSYGLWLRTIEGRGPGTGGPFWYKLAYSAAGLLLPGRYPRPSSGASLENWLGLVAYLPNPVRRRLWRRDYRDLAASLDLFEREYSRAATYTDVGKVQYLDLKTYLPFDILAKVDIASMMHGLEVRTPIVDRNVVEFAATIPDGFKIRKDGAGDWHGKLLLKKLMRKYYSAEFLDRRKMGFAVPIRKWFARNGSLHVEIRERLLGPQSTITQYFNPGMIRSLIKSNAAGPLWLLLFLEEWLRQHARRPVGKG